MSLLPCTGKNGVYDNLVNMVREAFEECELVRINCQGMNGSDYRKIGAKLKVCKLSLFAMAMLLKCHQCESAKYESATPKSNAGSCPLRVIIICI